MLASLLVLLITGATVIIISLAKSKVKLKKELDAHRANQAHTVLTENYEEVSSKRGRAINTRQNVCYTATVIADK